MKRFLCVLLSLVLLLTACASADSEFTLPEKMLKQIEAGSGFSAEIKLDFTDTLGKSRLQKPIPLNLTYIRNTEGSERQAELSLVSGENKLSTVNLNLSGNALAFQADVFSPDWYRLSLEKNLFALDGLLELLPGAASSEGEPAASEAAGAPAQEISPVSAKPLTMSGLMDMSGIPSLLERFLNLYAKYSSLDLAPLYDDFTVRLDLWLEGYRTEPQLEKDRKNQSILKVNYTVPVSAIKAELKTLILELLEKEELRTLLASPLNEEEQKLYLNPAYQDYYFAAVDALPLSGELRIDRVLSTLTGETQSLIVTLPLKDDETGDAELCYERTLKGNQNHHTFTLNANSSTLKVSFLQYTTDAGLIVSSGSFSSQRSSDEQKLDFVLTQNVETDQTLQQEDRCTVNLKLQITPDHFSLLGSSPLTVNLKAIFTSASAKTAATYLDGTASLELPDGSLSLTFTGKTRKKWDLVNLSEAPTDIASLPLPEALTLVTGCVGNLNTLLKDYLPEK